jgi:sugar/nucleoside kinase (ribokinase family)
MGYAVVLGEALIDLLEDASGAEPCYRPAVGGAPFNVAVGVARLGGHAEFVGSISTDRLGERLYSFLVENGVGTGGVLRVQAPTTLALTNFSGAEPDFAFYGDSHGMLGPDDLDAARVAGADVVYTGSIAMLRPPTLAAARAAWQVSGPLKVFDPNARPRLLTHVQGGGGPRPPTSAPFEPDSNAVGAYRAVVEEFATGADLMKLSAADAAILWDADEETVADRLAGLGHATVVITRGATGALLRHAGGVAQIAAPRVAAVDTTGAGDSVMAALVEGLLLTGRSGDPDWPALVRYALAVGALTVQGRGGATALPTAAAVRERFPQDVPSSSA